MLTRRQLFLSVSHELQEMDGEDVHADDDPGDPEQLIEERASFRCKDLPAPFKDKEHSRQEGEPVYADFGKGRVEKPAINEKADSYQCQEPYYL